MKTIGEIMASAGTILPPGSPAFSPVNEAPDEPLSHTIKREYEKLCPRYNAVFYPDAQTLRLIDCVAEYVQSKRYGWLVIFGGRGLGKTTVLDAAINALKARKANRIPTRFAASDIREWALKKDKSFPILGNTYRGEDAFFNVCENLSFIAIDDLGADIPDGSKEREGECLADYGTQLAPLKTVLEKRYEKNLPTIITTNESVPFIELHYGKRVADRITQKGYVAAIQLSGPSFRDPGQTGADRWKRGGTPAPYDSF